MHRTMLFGSMAWLVLSLLLTNVCAGNEGACDVTVIICGDGNEQGTCLLRESNARESITITNITVYTNITYNGSEWSKNGSPPFAVISQNFTVHLGESHIFYAHPNKAMVGSFALVSITYFRDNSSLSTNYEDVVMITYPVGMGPGHDEYWLLVPYGVLYLPWIGAFIVQAGIFFLNRPYDWAKMPSSAQYGRSMWLRIKYWPYYWVENGKWLWTVLIWLAIGFLVGMLAMTIRVLTMGYS